MLFNNLYVNLKDKQHNLTRQKKVSFGKENNHNNYSTFLKLETKNIKSAMDPYTANDSRQEEEENDEDNSLEWGEAMPSSQQYPQIDRLTSQLPWMPKITEKRDTEMSRKSSCITLIDAGPEDEASHDVAPCAGTAVPWAAVAKEQHEDDTCHLPDRCAVG